MSLAVKVFLAIFCFFNFGAAFGRDLNILIIDDGRISNCLEERIEIPADVYQIDRRGNVVPMQGPFAWSDCAAGHVWTTLAQELISQRLAERVVFMVVGRRGASAPDWLPGKQTASILDLAIATAKAKRIQFDYAFWQESALDYRSEAIGYRSKLNAAIKSISVRIPISKWIIAFGGSCGRGDKSIIDAQRENARNPIFNRYEGPNLSELRGQMVGKFCTLNKGEQSRLSKMWLKSMVSSESDSKRYRKETLLYYFK